MTRSELIALIAERFPQFPARDADLAVNMILEAMAEALMHGDRVEIRGFGSFGLSFRPPRTARNPKTGAPVEVNGKWVPHFKAGKELRERVQAAVEVAQQPKATARKKTPETIL